MSEQEKKEKLKSMVDIDFKVEGTKLVFEVKLDPNKDGEAVFESVNKINLIEVPDEVKDLLK